MKAPEVAHQSSDPFQWTGTFSSAWPVWHAALPLLALGLSMVCPVTTLLEHSRFHGKWPTPGLVSR